MDITITRAGDATGASGTGLLAAVLFDAIAPGGSTLSVSGVATGPDGASVPLTFVPATDHRAIGAMRPDSGISSDADENHAQPVPASTPSAVSAAIRSSNCSR